MGVEGAFRVRSGVVLLSEGPNHVRAMIVEVTRSTPPSRAVVGSPAIPFDEASALVPSIRTIPCAASIGGPTTSPRTPSVIGGRGETPADFVVVAS